MVDLMNVDGKFSLVEGRTKKPVSQIKSIIVSKHRWYVKPHWQADFVFEDGFVWTNLLEGFSLRRNLIEQIKFITDAPIYELREIK